MLFTLVGMVLPVVASAQLATRDAPLRFGIEYARAVPTGTFREATADAAGFLAWLALPLSGCSWVGLVGEFSVLTVPERQVEIADVLPGVDATVGLRTTLTFVGVGPRVEVRAGRLSLGASVMPGYTRVITDANAVVRTGMQLLSFVSSNSEYALGVKGGLYLAFPVYVGRQSTGVGFVTGLDFTHSARVPFPRDGSFGYDPATQDLTLERPLVALNYWRWHAGVGLEF